ncbi:MAG: hemerythrin family protein [Myxococcales bacterium]|nr:hemerythrin family protein [Myxococcales bacterium]
MRFSKYLRVDQPRQRIPTLPDGVSAQHGHLSASIHRLRHAHAAGEQWEELARLLDRLVQDVAEHFEHEELLMERGKYPAFEQHRNQHGSFLRRLTALRAECERRETELMGVLCELLEAWFKSHEETADRLALEFLKLDE